MVWNKDYECMPVEELKNFQLEKLKESDKSIIEHTAKGEMSAQELLVNSIRMIKRFEKNFDLETIDKWYKEGKLPNESHVEAFKSYI